jgi:mannitol operon transcriptional antiterminator
VNAAIKEWKLMLKNLLTPGRIQLAERAENWVEAIWLASDPLLQEGCIETSYVDAMIQNVNKLGPYIVVAPYVAIPHARPSDGVNRLSMSLLKLEEPVYFSEKEQHKVKLIIVLASEDNMEHLQSLSELCTMLSIPGNLEKFIEVRSREEILSMIGMYSGDESIE